MNKEKEEAARRDLNPIEDVKGAIKYLENLDPIEKVKEMFETGAELIEPREADVRAVPVEEDTRDEELEPED